MKYLFAVSTLFASVLFFSCKDEPDVFKESLQSLDNYTNRFKKPTETIRFANAAGVNFTTRRGNLLTVPADAFVYRNGEPVIGEVAFKVREVFTKAEMFGSGIFPVTANNEPLICGGQVCFEASQNGAELRVAPGITIHYEFVSSNQNQNTPMQLFMADGEIGVDSLAWETITNDSTLIGLSNPIAGSFNYELSIDSLAWYNCDAFWGLTTYDMVFKLEGIIDTNNFKSTVYGFVSDENSALKAYGPLMRNGEVFHHTALIEQEFSMLAIALQDGELYYDLKTITPSQADTLTMDLEKTTSIELDGIIEGL